MQGIKGSVGLVTGGSRGLGRACAVDLARNGVNVAVNYIGSQDAAQQTLREVQNLGVKGMTIKADVSKVKEIKDMFSQIEQELGVIQIVVNNAGITRKKPLEEISEDDWDSVIQTNLKSAFFVSQSAIPGMKQKGWGRIINMSSVAAQTGGVIGPNYAASKSGLIGLTHSFASLLSEENITCNNVAPALIQTDMLIATEETRNLIPMKRFGKPEEVSDVVVMLAKNGYITGQTINVNGGWYFS